MAVLINLNDGLPAPPRGRSNVKWQKDTTGPTNVSGYIEVGGVNAQTGTSYELVPDDQGKLLTFDNADPVAASLLPANQMPGGFWLFIRNYGAGAVTLTPETSTIDDEASLTLEQDQSCILFSDGLNYKTLLIAGGGGATVVSLVGVTIDGGGAEIATGFKGSVQLDFAGTIIGWSIEETSGNAGDIEIEVDKHAGTETLPVVPNTTTDKISASAPIALSSATGAGAGAAAVSTWTAEVAQWDSIGFNVASATTVQRVTLWLRIQRS
jgi:hypothetical protein